MSAGTFLVTILAGGLGAVVRFVVDGLIMRRITPGFPWGTFAINATGSLLLGFLTGLADSSLLDASLLFILGGGFCGGYTTFSTAMVDTMNLIQKGQYRGALLNGGGLLLLCVSVAAIGLALGRSL